MKPTLKMYVWEDVLRDYTAGMICVLAHNLEEAMRLIGEKYPQYIGELGPYQKYRVVEEPEAFAVYGGG